MIHTQHTLNFLRYVFTPGDIIELRAMSRTGKIISGRFRDFDRAAKVASAVDAEPGVAAVYFGLNPVPASAAERIGLAERMQRGRAASDGDIARRNLYLIDFDPVRPSGVCSTDEEKLAAYASALRVRDYLRGEGWPDPIIADSGNGYHLYYRGDGCDPVSPYWSSVLALLHATFGSDKVIVDTSVANPARVSRLPGTHNRKGEDTANRPHRPCMVVEYPDKFTPLNHGKIYRLANKAGVAPKSLTSNVSSLPGDRELLDNIEIRIAAFAREIGNAVTHTFSRGSDTYFVLDVCPFVGRRHSGDPNKTAIHLRNGNVGFRCLSDECTGKGMKDLRELHRDRTGEWPKTAFYKFSASAEVSFEREVDDYYRRMEHTVQFRADVAHDLNMWEAGIWPPPPHENEPITVDRMRTILANDEPISTIRMQELIDSV